MHQTHMHYKPQASFVIAAITMISIAVINTAHASTASTYQLAPTNSLTSQTNLHAQSLSNSSPRSSNRQRNVTTTSLAVDPKLIGAELYQSITQQHGSNIAGSKSAQRTSLITTAQQNNLKTLNTKLQRTGGIKVAFNKTSGTPTFIKPKGSSILPSIVGLGVTKLDKNSIAMGFLNENRALLKLEDPVNELTLINQTTDKQGKSHFRFQQTINSVPVWGKQALVHLDKTSGVYLFQGNYEPTPTGVNTTPEITANDAIEATLFDLEISSPLSKPAESELTVYINTDGSPILSFMVEVSPAMDQRWVYFIDAVTGTIIHKINNIHKNVVEASGTGLDGETKTFNTWHNTTGDNHYYLIDPSTPTLAQNADPVVDGPQSTGDTYIFDADGGDGSSLNYSTNTTSTNWLDPVAVDAAYHTRQVYDYYQNIFNRNSIDGNNKNLIVVINYGQNINNAFWNGTSMVYGNGDNIVFSPLAGCLDVAAHEMTHGVIESSANLFYANQSGALNESFADVFGAMVDNNDWLVGEDCTIASPGHLRNMANPADGLSSQPTHMDEYQNLPNTPEGNNGGVHVNSGIPNRAAYLIAEGLTEEGLGTSIGRPDTAEIYYRALTTYLTPYSQFIDARFALIQAAEDLYDETSTQAIAVAAAFDAVGITEDGASPPKSAPTPTDPVAGDDMMAYLYPVDTTHDSWDEDFFLYTQVMDKPFAGYNGTKDFGPFNTQAQGDRPALYTKPAIVTNSTGTDIYYVANDFNVYLANLAGQDIQMTFSGNVFSIAVSPDDRYISYTSLDNYLYVLDLENGTTTAHPIIPPNYQADELTDNSILFADAMSFDYTSSTIVFDALNCLSTPDSACAGGAGYRFWSIGIFDLTNNQFSFPIASQNPDIDLGYPSFAANNNFVITMDLHDYSLGSVASSAIAIDFENQVTQTLYDFGSAPEGFWSIPSFWGNDDYATMQAVATGGQSGGISASRIAIDASWQGSGTFAAVNDFAVAMPVMHRAGVRTLSGTLTPSTAILNFGTVASGASSQLTLTLSNTGNSDVNITGFSLNSDNFSHNGLNTRVPRNSEVTITVTYTAGETSGTEVSTLNIALDNQPALAVALTASANSPTAPSPPVNSGGGGGSSDPLSLVLALLALFLTGISGAYSTKYRRRYKSGK